MNKHLWLWLSKCCFAFAFLGILWGAVSQTTAAVFADGLPQSELQALSEYPNYVGTLICSNDSGSSPVAGTTAPTQTGSTWAGTAQPPYYLEQYVINILQDIAQKLNVPVSSTVTQEHVVAMIAWAYAEGGNITPIDPNSFNVWNGGLTSRPDLVAGAVNASGLESFNSFNSGVEANAIMMTASYQNRIGTILTQSGSTAEQVEHAIAYYDQTAGDKAWAWGPNSSDAAAVLQFNHTTYITSLLDRLSAVRQVYAQAASVIIGPGEVGAHHVNSSELQFTGGTSNAGATPVTSGVASTGCGAVSANCQAATGDTKILCEAEPYAGVYYRWGGGHGAYNTFVAGCPNPSNPPNNQPHGSPPDPTDNNQSGNPSPCATDCSGLVSIAVDAAFGQNFSWSVGSLESDTTNWQPIQEAEVRPGDVVVKAAEHIEIVDHYDASTGSLYTFGSHDTGTMTGEITTRLSDWTGAYTYIGPGSGGN